jgi:hypothetical protein
MVENPLRFITIYNEGTNDGEAPFVSISSPTNNSVLEGEIMVSVVATSTYPIVVHSLFVDGQEIQPTEDGTNYIINTCEWLNGPHTIFATATAHSDNGVPSGVNTIYTGRNVSHYVQVSFTNLISNIAFSEPYFEPSLGQTQHVSASLAANSDWSIEVIDTDSNVWRTVTGSGTSIGWDWNGLGENNATIPDGVYYYRITAQTNGQSFAAMRFDNPTMAMESVSEPMEPLVVSDYAIVPLALYPPGMDTNGLMIVDASLSELTSLLSSAMDFPELPPDDGNGETNGVPEEGSPFYGSPSQSAIAPQRPPTSPVKNTSGNFGVFYYTYSSPVTWSVPKWGPLNTKVQIEGSIANVSFSTIPDVKKLANNFAKGMKKYGWKQTYNLSDTNLPVSDLRRSDSGVGGADIMAGVNIGLFISHGCFGTSPDGSPGSSMRKLTYFPSGNSSDSSNPWLRMSQIGFGGQLKWAAIMACNSLCDPDWFDMVQGGAIPLKDTHLLCGATTVFWQAEYMGNYWAKNMLKKKQKITESWFNCAKEQYKNVQPGVITNDIYFRVTGYPECLDDYVYTNTVPSNPSSNPGNLDKVDAQVYP